VWRTEKVGNEGKIDAYIRYFEGELKLIFALPNPLYRKILAVGVIDTLGRARHPNVGANRARFLRTVEDLAGWPDMGRVSLPQLWFQLGHQPELIEGQLADEVSRLLLSWEEGRVYQIVADPLFETLAPLARQPAESRMLLECRHLELLYAYRNVLIHEFREPGYDMGVLADDPTPYYMGVDDEQGVGRWELAYPTNFFEIITRRILRNLRAYLEVNDIDPYTLYQFGSMWRPRR
jgi:hypothetical protein